MTTTSSLDGWDIGLLKDVEAHAGDRGGSHVHRNP